MDYKGQCKNDGHLKTDNIQWNKFQVKERVSHHPRNIKHQMHQPPETQRAMEVQQQTINNYEHDGAFLAN